MFSLVSALLRGQKKHEKDDTDDVELGKVLATEGSTRPHSHESRYIYNVPAQNVVLESLGLARGDDGGGSSGGDWLFLLVGVAVLLEGSAWWFEAVMLCSSGACGNVGVLNILWITALLIFACAGMGMVCTGGWRMLKRMTRQNVRLVFFSCVIIFAHTSVTWFEELLFKAKKFDAPFFMIWFMCTMYVVMHSAVAPFLFRHHTTMLEFGAELRRRDLHGAFLAMCLAYAGSNTVSKLSLEYVSVPLQIVFKSCKLVAVMIGSSCIMGRKYSCFDYLVAISLVMGMVCFAGADVMGQTQQDSLDMNTLIGAFALIAALFCDSILGNLQEKMQKGGMCDEIQLMYFQSIFGMVFLTVVTLITGEMQAGVLRCVKEPGILTYLSVWSVLCVFGIVFMLKIAGEFSAVTAVLTSSLRKILSLVVSYSFFPKPVSYGHILGIVSVFGAILAHSWYKQRAKQKATAALPTVGDAMVGASKTPDEEQALSLLLPPSLRLPPSSSRAVAKTSPKTSPKFSPATSPTGDDGPGLALKGPLGKPPRSPQIAASTWRRVDPNTQPMELP